MLKISKKITITGQSVINGAIAESYQATIDSSNPANMTMTSWQTAKDVYKANRAECRQNEADFEDMVYELQDQMIAELGDVEPEEVVDPELVAE